MATETSTFPPQTSPHPPSSQSSCPTFNSKPAPSTGAATKKKSSSQPIAAGSTKKIGWWERWKNLDLLALWFAPKPASKLSRTIYIAQPLPQHHREVPRWILRKGDDAKGRKPWGFGGNRKVIDEEGGWLYATNQVLTSKYNIFTFVPKNLLEQFRRVANVFFLVLVILQFFPIFQNVSPGLAAFPLLVVIVITGLKDGYEDIKRHESDQRTNGIECLAMHTGEQHEGLHLPHLFTHSNPEGQDAPFNPNHTEEKEKKIHVPGASWVLRKVVNRGKTLDEEEGLDLEKKGTIDGGREERQRVKWWGKRTVKTKAKKKHQRKAIKEIDTETALEKVSDAVTSTNEEVAQPSHPHWGLTTWEDIKVGQFLLIRSDESIPADCLILATSEEENVAYVETKNLDGETNLKSRVAVGGALSELLGGSDVTDGIAKPSPNPEDVVRKVREIGGFQIESERPDTNMFKYNGALVVKGVTGEIEKFPITINEVLLRGCVVRNTDWVLCVAIFTGRDSKIVLNSGGTPSKRSRIEKQMDPQVFVNLGLLAVMCVICGIGDHFFEQYFYDHNSYWTVGSNKSDDNPRFNGLIAFLNGMITFQNVVPISLYISIEFVRTTQAFYIYMDNEIYYRTTPDGQLIEGDTSAVPGGVDRRTTAKSWNLSDDLGQVEYIFSDKTGTLTQNSMVFRQCAIGGRVYIGTEKGLETISEQKTPERRGEGLGEEARSSASESLPAPRLDDHKPMEGSNTFFDANLNKDLSDDPDSIQARKIHGFFTNLALCHTVLASAEEDGTIHYKAQSPDESALVQAAADVGFIFLGRDKNILKLSAPGTESVSEWELLTVLEFTSARKRMSIVVRRLGVRNTGDDGDGELNHMVEGTGRLFLLTKGADNVIFERLAPGQESERAVADAALEEFAGQGLRTLCLAFRELDEDEYDQWNKDYNEATTLIEGRDEKIEEVSSRLESNLLFLGSTAIEDRLQDGVPETIADLRRAGIKIWVATGDKLETAIAIGKTCNLLSKDMNLIIIRGGEFGAGNRSAYAQIALALERFFNGADIVASQLNQPPNHDRADSAPRPSISYLRRSIDHARLKRTPTGMSDIVGGDNGEKGGGYGLVIDGGSLTHAFAEPYTKDLLLELSTRCNTVICCRTSPLQKALIVKLVKNGLGALCLAIGDGANDVSMIQAADVGVGVAGEEGLQAVNSSDYAIAQFRYLKRLLLVHGHLSYFRNSNMINNFFEKEIIGIGVLFWFQFYCLFSTTTVYEYTYLLFYNVFWTLVPVLAIGIFDFDLRPRTLMAVPEIYRFGREGAWFGLKRFSWYMLEGILQSVVVYFIILYTYPITTARGDGYDPIIYEFSTVMIIAAVFICNFFNGFNTRSWNWVVLVGVLIGPVLILAYSAIYQTIKPGWIWTRVYGNNTFVYTACNAYLSFLITIFICLVPRFTYRYYKELYAPNDIDILRYVERVDPKHDFENDPMMPGVSAKQRFVEEGSQEDETPLRPPGKSRESVELRQVVSARSQTHDMSSPGLASQKLSGYAFAQADSVGTAALGAPIRRYTSNLSANEPKTNRARSRSIKVGGVEFGFPALTTQPLRKSVFRRISRAKDTSSLAPGDVTPRKGDATPTRRDGFLGRLSRGNSAASATISMRPTMPASTTETEDHVVVPTPQILQQGGQERETGTSSS